MDIGLRKIATFTEETMLEGGKTAPRPVTMVVVAAVVKNPWAGQGFVENLRPEILRIARPLGLEMTRRLVAAMPGERVEAYGKAAIVGVGGEIEHASALIHTLRFGNVFREAVSGLRRVSGIEDANRERLIQARDDLPRLVRKGILPGRGQVPALVLPVGHPVETDENREDEQDARQDLCAGGFLCQLLRPLLPEEHAEIRRRVEVQPSVRPPGPGRTHLFPRSSLNTSR